MANHQGFNPGANQARMNTMMNSGFRMPPPSNQIRPTFPQGGYQPNPNATPYPIPQQFISVQQPPQHIYYPPNGVRNPAPMQYQHVPQAAPAASTGGYNTYAPAAAASLQAASSAQPQQSIYQQPFFAGGQHFGYAARGPGGQYQYLVQQMPPGTNLVHQPGTFMPGGMTPHTGQPTPMPNPGGAPMPGGPPIPPQQQQQPNKPPYQQVQIPASVPPPSSTPSQLPPQVPVSISSTGISVSAASFQPQQPLPPSLVQPHVAQQQQIAVTQPPPSLAKREKKILQFINPETGRSIFNNGAAAAAASTPSVNASGPPPSVAVTKESATAENEKPESVAPKQMQQSVPSTDIKEATPPPPSGPPPTRGSGESNVNAHPQDKEMLSVAVENKRDDQGLYEPVSPTPLPDSPVEENKGVATAPATKSQDKSLQDDDSHNSELAKQRKKKPLGQRKAELNRKGEEKERKGGDMLDVFKVSDSQPEPAPKQSTPEAAKPGGGFKEPTPPVSVAPTKEATPPFVTEKAASSAAASREPTPLMSESSKHASPEHFNHKSETVKVNGVGSSEKADKMDNNSGDKLSTPANHIQEVEEGEIIDDTDEGSIGGLEFKLKYKYNEEQWSPLNPAGKKQYEREFLIQLQYDEMSQIKPENLPDMDIIKDKPIRRDIPRASYNFEPSYIKSSVSQSRGHGGPGGHGGHGLGKRPSKSKEPVKRINIPSFSQNVELRKSDKAWKPAVAGAEKKKSAEPEGDALEELVKKVRAILNKLTPQKFETLVKQFQELPIDKKEKMESAMELVFEKAVDEPAFSVAYAQMCHNLAQREISDGDEKVKFRTILIRRVQKEFDKDYMKDVNMELKKKSEDTSLSDAERKMAREEFETQERKARKRSLGNIRFIGELYNLQLLTLNIMHDCVNKLISKTDEESLECLCKLITTVGSQFDKETNVVLANQKEGKISKIKMEKSYPSVRAINVYFDRMHFIIEKRTTSSRVRFLMQDVIDLKKASWKKRREEAGPKKIDQIHEDMKKEEMFQSLNNQNTMSMPKQRDSMGPPSGDARKRSQKAPQTDSDGWTVTTRAARNTLDKVDTNKIKNMQSRNLTDVDTISLAPKTGGWGQWGKGASSSRNSSTRQEQEINTGNRFGAFVSSEGSSNSPYEGRTSGGYDRGGYEGRSSSGYGGGRMGDRGGSRPGSYVGRSSRGQSSEQEKAIQAVKSMHPAGSGPGGRSVSTIMPDRSSRTSVPSKSASMRIHSKSRDQEDVGFQGKENEDEDKLKMLSESRVNEFLSTKDYKEAHQSIREKFHSTTVHVFIEKSLEFCLEKRLEEIKLVGLLFSSLLKEGIVTEEKFIRGLSFILEIGGDLEIDIPKFWDTLAAHLVASVMDGHLSLSALMAASRTKEPVVKNRGKFLAAVLHGCKGESESRVGQVWADSGLDLATCLSETGSQDIESFIRDNKLEFLQNSGAGRGPAAAGGNQSSYKPLAASGFDAASFCKELRDRLKADSSKVVNFVNDRSKDRQNPDFVQGLVTTLAEHCIDGLGGPVADVKLKDEPFAELCMDVLKSLDFSTDEEMQCIFAIQMLATKLEHPTGLFFNLLNQLYQSDVVSFPAAKAWKEDSKADNQRGKGVCVSSCNHLLIEMQMEFEEGENNDDMETN